MSSVFNLTELENLSHEDIQEEYSKLLKLYDNSKQLQENDCQQIHELKRNLSVSKAAEQHLNHELEIVTRNQNTQIDNVQAKYQRDIDEIRKKYSDLEEYNANLEQTIEKLKLKEEMDKIKIDYLELQQKTQPNGNSVNIENDKELIIERENMDLLKKIDDFQDEIDKTNRVVQEKERQISLLKEQLRCVEENLSSKREELEEKTTLLESTQERMVEMNSELAMLKTAPENIDRKGNSLFAEVDDQRQVMKQLLATQKKNYLQMKKVYNESEYEIRRLKRENAAMHSELKVCASIYLNAEKTYKDKLNKRILQLLKQNEDFEKKIDNREDQLVNIANEKGVNCIDSMLTFCKNETRELQAELKSLRLDKSALDHSLRDSQQELSKWRFEALKSRCIIIDREALLEENGIQYNHFQLSANEFTSNKLKNVKPRIFDNLNTDKYKYIKEENGLSKSESTLTIDGLKTEDKNECLQLSQINDVEIIEVTHSEDSHISLNSSSIMIPNNIEFENDKSLQTELSELSNRNLKTEFEIYEDTSPIGINLTKIKPNEVKNEQYDQNITKSCDINSVQLERIKQISNDDKSLQDDLSEFSNRNLKTGFEIYEDTSPIDINLTKIKPNDITDEEYVLNGTKSCDINNVESERTEQISIDSNSLQDELSESSNRNIKSEIDIYEHTSPIDINLTKLKPNEVTNEEFVIEVTKSCDLKNVQSKCTQQILVDDKSLHDKLSGLSNRNLKTEFEIYGDTSPININLTKIKPNEVMNEDHVQNILKPCNINKAQSECTKQMLTERLRLEYQSPQPMKIIPLKRKSNQEISSIEFKKSNMRSQNENQGQKSVTFNEIKNSPMVKSENNDKITKTRIKSNIIMRKIVIKSATEKKSK